MLTESDLSDSIVAYEHTTIASITAAKKVLLPPALQLSFSTRKLSEEQIIELATKIPTGAGKAKEGVEFIYIFSIRRPLGIPKEQILSAFNEARSVQHSDSYAGKKNLCKPNPLSPESKALYVGRSHRPRERFKNHLRSSNSGTFAMHLTTWASNIDLELDFHLYGFHRSGDRVIQVLEDGLWDHLRPMLGRRGER